MANLTPSDIAFQNAGKYLLWKTQETGSTTVNGTPTAGNSGVSVLGSQKTKITVTPNSGATLSFRVWIEYTGRQGFYLADGFDRGGIDTAWTQEINTSGASRLYVEVTAIDTGNFDVEMAPAGQDPTLNARPTLTNELFLWDAYSENPYFQGGEALGALRNLEGVLTPAVPLNTDLYVSKYQPSGLNSSPSANFDSARAYTTDHIITSNNSWTLMFAGAAQENTGDSFNAVSAWGSLTGGGGVILLSRFGGTFEWAIGGFSGTYDIQTGVTPRSNGDVVVITSDGSTTRIYVNGTEESSKSLTWSITAVNDLHIGRNINGDEHFLGDMCALLYAQHAATAQEVTDLTTFFSDRYNIPQ